MTGTPDFRSHADSVPNTEKDRQPGRVAERQHQRDARVRQVAPAEGRFVGQRSLPVAHPAAAWTTSAKHSFGRSDVPQWADKRATCNGAVLRAEPRRLPSRARLRGSGDGVLHRYRRRAPGRRQRLVLVLPAGLARHRRRAASRCWPSSTRTCGRAMRRAVPPRPQHGEADFHGVERLHGFSTTIVDLAHGAARSARSFERAPADDDPGGPVRGASARAHRFPQGRRGRRRGGRAGRRRLGALAAARGRLRGGGAGQHGRDGGRLGAASSSSIATGSPSSTG